MPSASFEPGDVLVVPFPFTDSATTKRRPALVLSGASFNRGNGHIILAMVTSARHSRWLGDVVLRDWRKAGLPRACLVRLKLFTLDGRFVQRVLGRLSARDYAAVQASLAETVPL